MQRLSLCMSLPVWFCSFSSRNIMYDLFIISILSVNRNWDKQVDFFFFSLRFSTKCVFICENVKRGQISTIMPLCFLLCLIITFYISKILTFVVFHSIKMTEWQISAWVFRSISSFLRFPPCRSHPLLGSHCLCVDPTLLFCFGFFLAMVI